MWSICGSYPILLLLLLPLSLPMLLRAPPLGGAWMPPPILAIPMSKVRGRCVLGSPFSGSCFLDKSPRRVSSMSLSQTYSLDHTSSVGSKSHCSLSCNISMWPHPDNHRGLEPKLQGLTRRRTYPRLPFYSTNTPCSLKFYICQNSSSPLNFSKAHFAYDWSSVCVCVWGVLCYR